MNVNDTEIARGILKKAGYLISEDIQEVSILILVGFELCVMFHLFLSSFQSDVVLLMTCSIREGAEQKIWRRIHHLKNMNLKRRAKNSDRAPFKIGVLGQQTCTHFGYLFLNNVALDYLGCMAENLKKKLLEKEKAIDVICGPDAYRDLPHMLAAVDGGGPAAGDTLANTTCSFML